MYHRGGDAMTYRAASNRSMIRGHAVATRRAAGPPSAAGGVGRGGFAAKPARWEGVKGVDVAVGEAVERHCGTAGERHAQEDAGQLKPLELALDVPGEHGTEQRERQGEQRVAEADQLQETAHLLHGEVSSAACGFAP